MQSPGHKKWPDHKVRERKLGQRVQVAIEGEVVADSDDVIEVDEDGHPKRLYFARDDVRMDKLERSDTESECPFKGHASYFHVNSGGKHFDDAAWTYEEPYDEHAALQGRIAFYAEQVPSIEFRAL
ncbi:MAG: DUF427 domain-containing protein [Gammaproteobacteria bacterium]|nr:hypothetical protein [Gammaproteobacteria bacterium]